MKDSRHPLAPREARFVALLAAGVSAEDAAKQVGISRRTGFRWAKRPELAEAKAVAVQDALEVSLATAAMTSRDAVKALRNIVLNPSHGEHARVALAFLNRLPEPQVFPNVPRRPMPVPDGPWSEGEGGHAGQVSTTTATTTGDD